MSEILVRGLPEDVRAWIAGESHENHLSQNEFVLRVLHRAYSGRGSNNGQLPLFPPPSASRSEPDTAVPFSFIDLFAGIGGLRIALEAVGGKCRFSSEWDKHCQEYELFKLVERKLYEPELSRTFKSVDEFLERANSILQRRKSRAGLSLEHHVEGILTDAGIPFERQPKSVDGQPDIVIPSAREYHDPKWPNDKLFAVGVKRTCKDRWRQVLNEATRLKRKHILTIQPGISAKQLTEMCRAHVTVVVPQELHKKYPPEWRTGLMTVDRFIRTVRKALA